MIALSTGIICAATWMEIVYEFSKASSSNINSLKLYFIYCFPDCCSSVGPHGADTFYERGVRFLIIKLKHDNPFTRNNSAN